MLLRHPGQITSDATISCVIVKQKQLYLQAVLGPLATRLGALCWGAGSASMAVWSAAWITGTFRRYSTSPLWCQLVSFASVCKALCTSFFGLAVSLAHISMLSRSINVFYLPVKLLGSCIQRLFQNRPWSCVVPV